MENDYLFNKGEINKDTLDKLHAACCWYKTRQKRVKELQEDLKKAEKELEEIAREAIPNLLNEKGISEIKLSTGEKIIVKQKLKASLAQERIHAALQEMMDMEPEEQKEVVKDLFKNEVVVQGSEKEREKVKQFCLDNGITYNEKLSIHNQTLAAYCRRKYQAGESITDKIKVYTYEEAEVE